MDRIDDQLLEELRGRLEDERAREQERLAEEDEITEDGKELHNIALGETGQAAAAQVTRQRSQQLGTRDHTESRLGKIEHALERMDNGDYGICEVCGGTIEEDRLRAYPLATRCIDDAEADLPGDGTT